MKKILLSEKEKEIIYKNAEKAEIGGHSYVRQKDRMSNLSADQITAQLGEAALSKFLTGDINLYIKTRKERNKNRYQGDSGTDLLGMRVDAKTSRMRRGLYFPYHLYVRDAEYHEDIEYYLCLIPENADNVVYIAGKISGKNLPSPIGNRREIRMDALDKV